MCGDTICGGYSSSTTSSCLRLSVSGTFLPTNISLLQPRYRNSCLASPLGVLLLGDKNSRTSTELVRPDGSTASSFTLRYDVEYCDLIFPNKLITLTFSVSPAPST